jgi:hypothetical protein
MRGADIGVDYIIFTIYVATILVLEERKERVDVGVFGDSASLEVGFVLVEALEGKVVHDFWCNFRLQIYFNLTHSSLGLA